MSLHALHRTKPRLAVAIHNCSKAIVVEYIASAEDGWGRVYARQVCAQQLPRDVRVMVDGCTHKEVDMSGAHYEIIRRLVQSNTLPPIHVLREQLLALWQGHSIEQCKDKIKRFPIRVINAGVASTLRHVATAGLAMSTTIEAIAYELELARDVVTKEILPHHRPDLSCTGANKHFFALD